MHIHKAAAPAAALKPEAMRSGGADSQTASAPGRSDPATTAARGKEMKDTQDTQETASLAPLVVPEQTQTQMPVEEETGRDSAATGNVDVPGQQPGNGGVEKKSGTQKARNRMVHALYEAPIYNVSASAPVAGVGCGCRVWGVEFGEWWLGFGVWGWL